MKPFISHTGFGEITAGDKTYYHDILIRPDGTIEKRKKKLSKKVYGTSHTLSAGEADYILEQGVPVIIGSGQYGVLQLSEEAKKLFRENGCSVIIADTPAAILKYNKADAPCVGLFHVTC